MKLKTIIIGLGIFISAMTQMACDNNTSTHEETASDDGTVDPSNDSAKNRDSDTVVISDSDTQSSNDVDVDVTDSSKTGWSGGTDGTVVIADDGAMITDDDGHQFVCIEARCDGRLLECGDCKDNDGDGQTDWRDRECLGPRAEVVDDGPRGDDRARVERADGGEYRRRADVVPFGIEDLYRARGRVVGPVAVVRQRREGRGRVRTDWLRGPVREADRVGLAHRERRLDGFAVAR